MRFLSDAPFAARKIFMPQDEAPDKPPRFGAASRWKETQLRMLNIEYDPTLFYSFNFDSVPVSQELRQSISIPSSSDARRNESVR